MAEMIPASISASTTATKGEKHLFYLLQEALLPDDDFIVWYDQTVGNKHPDFIVYGQHMGLLIIEVKDWSLKQIREITPEKFTVEIGGNIQRVDSPLVQARKAYQQLMDKVKTQPALLHPDGPHQGQPHFPIGYAAAFSNIDRVAAERHGMLQVIPKIQCLFEDDLDFDPTDKATQQDFRQRIKPCFNITVQFNGEPLNQTQLRVLRHAIFPEVRIANVRQLPGPTTEADLQILDRDQERIAKSIGAGHRILKGVAGSGKTLVVAARAKYLKQCHPDWQILVLCYNVSLSKHIRRLMEVSGDSIDVSDIDVFHFLGLVKSVMGGGFARADDEPFEDWEARVTDAFCNAVGRSATRGMHSPQQNRHLYDAILVDEGQDFTVDMVRGLVGLLNQNTDSLLFCYDPSQNVFGREIPRWKDAGLQVQGKKPVELRTSYRNTSEVMELATRFAQMPKQQEMTLESILVPQKIDRHGCAPILKELPDDRAVSTYILDEIDRYIRELICSWSDIGILYANRYEEFPLLFNSAFYKRFAFEDADRLFWVNQTNETRHNLDLAAENVKMCTIESSKGLEFKVVFFVGLDLMPRHKRDPETERRLAYVAMTRAQEYLHLPVVETSSFVSEVKALL